MKRALHRAMFALLCLAAAVPGPAPAGDAPAGFVPLSALPRERIVVETRAARRYVFEAWLTDTFASRAQGLMFVPEIRPDQAMIFLYDPAQLVSMWMKNTLIPLDMLFVDAAGCIVRLHAGARPHSLDSIESGVPVALVVEVAGGEAAARGIGVGDRVIRPEANWPRESRPCGH